MPKSSKELPLVVYTDKDGISETYYFDTLIGNGHKYNDSKFTPLDINEKDGETTYGELLLKVVKNNISINNFESNVNTNVPEYLKQNITSIGYTVPDFTLFGELFLEKLNDAMKETGDKIVKAYVNSTDTVEITASINGKKEGIISSKKVAKS